MSFKIQLKIEYLLPYTGRRKVLENIPVSTNTEYLIKKGANRLYLLKMVRSYGASEGDLLALYCTVIHIN